MLDRQDRCPECGSFVYIGGTKALDQCCRKYLGMSPNAGHSSRHQEGGMLVVIGVDVRSVVDNPHYFDAVRKHHPRVSIQDLAEIPFPKEVPLELVRGTTFINDRGQEITIGMTQEVQEAIGLPMDVFNSQTEQIDKLNHEVAQKVQEVKELKTALKDYRTMTVWGRVKFLFSGVEDKLAEAYESCAKAVSNTLFK